MTSGEGDRHRKIPENWDVLGGAETRTFAAERPTDPEPTSPAAPSRPPIINLMASFWADGVSVLAVVTATLLSLSGTGHREVVAALPWAVALGCAWWVFAASLLLTIRQGTPGMLLAGIEFNRRVAPARVVAVIVVSALGAVLLGLPGLLGAQRSPLALAGGCPLAAVPVE